MAKINVSVSSNSSKPNVTVSKGPVGPQGEQGIQGEAGPQGVEGTVSDLESIPNVQIPSLDSGGYIAVPNNAGQYLNNALVYDPENNRWTTWEAATGGIETSQNKVGSPPPSNLWTDPIITVDLSEATSVASTRLALNNSSYIPSDVNLYVNGPSRFNGSLQIASGGSTVYTLPSADGTANQILKTDGSGVISFTGNYADLDGDQVVTGIKFFTAKPVLTSGLTVSNGGINVTGASQLGSATFSGSLTAQQLTFANNGTSIIAPTTVGALLPDDLEIRSNGNILIKLDTDNNESAQKFIVADYNDAERFSVQEDGAVRISNAYTLPSSDGATGQFLKTDGSGNISFAAASSLALGTTSTTALAGDTTTITPSQASAITSNTAKTGITPTQAGEITANTAKVSYTDAAVDSRIGAASVDDLSDVDTTTASPTTGQALVWDGSQWEPGTIDTSQWTTATNDIHYTTGNVGIGTTTPSNPLHITGTAKADIFSVNNGLSFQGASNNGLNISDQSNAKANAGVLIGHGAARFVASVYYGTIIGQGAGARMSNTYHVVAVGQNANSGSASYSKTKSVGVGGDSAYNGGEYNTAIGYETGRQSPNTYTNSVMVGYKAGNSGGNNSVFVGYEAGKSDGVQLVSDTIAIGYQALTALTTGTSNTAVGHQAGLVLTTQTHNTYLGHGAGVASTASGQTLIGSASKSSSITNGNNVGVGYLANAGSAGVSVGYQAASGTYGVSLGWYAGQQTTAGQFNIKIGETAGRNQQGNRNIIIGGSACLSGSSSDNIAIGQSTNAGGTTVAVGGGAGNATGSGNIFLGYNSGSAETGSNKLYIENSSSTTPLIYGEFDNDIVRINGTLQVGDPAGTGYALPAATGTTGQILSVNASGDLAFAAAGGGGGDVVDDTTPQLGGDLDVNSNKITSTAAGEILVEPDTSGVTRIANPNGNTTVLKLGGNTNSGGSVHLDFKHHTTANNAGASIRSSGGSYGTGSLSFYAKGTNTSDGADLVADNLIAKMSYNNGLQVYKNFSVLGGDLQFGHVGNNTSAEKRLGVKADEPNPTQSSLHLEAGSATYSGRGGGNLRLKAGAGAGPGDSGVISFWSCEGILSSGTNTNLERMRISPEGYLGIGTTSPTNTLHVDGTLKVEGSAEVQLDSSTSETFTIHDGTHDLFQVDTTTTGTLFGVNDVSGLPMFQSNSDGTMALPQILTSAPTATAPEGTMQLGIVSSTCYLYVYINGGWKSTTLT